MSGRSLVWSGVTAGLPVRSYIAFYILLKMERHCQRVIWSTGRESRVRRASHPLPSPLLTSTRALRVVHVILTAANVFVSASIPATSHAEQSAGVGIGVQLVMWEQ